MQDEQIVLCERCGYGAAQEPHTCPYAEDIADDRLLYSVYLLLGMRKSVLSGYLK